MSREKVTFLLDSVENGVDSIEVTFEASKKLQSSHMIRSLNGYAKLLRLLSVDHYNLVYVSKVYQDFIDLHNAACSAKSSPTEIKLLVRNTLINTGERVAKVAYTCIQAAYEADFNVEVDGGTAGSNRFPNDSRHIYRETVADLKYLGLTPNDAHSIVFNADEVDDGNVRIRLKREFREHELSDLRGKLEARGYQPAPCGDFESRIQFEKKGNYIIISNSIVYAIAVFNFFTSDKIVPDYSYDQNIINKVVTHRLGELSDYRDSLELVSKIIGASGDASMRGEFNAAMDFILSMNDDLTNFLLNYLEKINKNLAKLAHTLVITGNNAYDKGKLEAAEVAGFIDGNYEMGISVSSRTQFSLYQYRRVDPNDIGLFINEIRKKGFRQASPIFKVSNNRLFRYGEHALLIVETGGGITLATDYELI